MKDFIQIFSKNGKQMFPHNGMIIPSGCLVQIQNGSFVTLDTDHVFRKKTNWDNLSQSKDTEMSLTPIEK